MMKRYIPLAELKKYHLQHRADGGPLKDMALFTRARLSVQPLTTGKSEVLFSLEKRITNLFFQLIVQLIVLLFLCRGV